MKNEPHPFDQLSQPAQRALANIGIKTLEQLSGLTEKEFMALHGIGKSSLGPLKAAMQAQGLEFKTK